MIIKIIVTIVFVMIIGSCFPLRLSNSCCFLHSNEILNLFSCIHPMCYQCSVQNTGKLKPLPPSEAECQYPSYSLTSRWKKWHWHRKYRMHLLDRNHSCLRGYYYIIIKMIFIISSLHPGSCFSCRFSKFILFSSLNYDSISFLLHTAYVLSMSLENTGRFISKRRDKWQKIYFDF